MTADHQPQAPDKTAAPGVPSAPASRESLHAVKVAGLVFSGVALSLAGVFAIVEFSSRHSGSIVEADIKGVNVRLDAQQAATAQRFTGVDLRLDKIDERFARIDERFEQMDRRFEKIDERFEKVDEQFRRMDDRFERLESRLDMKLERLETKVDRKLDTVTELLLQLVVQKADRSTGDGLKPARQGRQSSH